MIIKQVQTVKTRNGVNEVKYHDVDSYQSLLNIMNAM